MYKLTLFGISFEINEWISFNKIYWTEMEDRKENTQISKGIGNWNSILSNGSWVLNKKETEAL